MPGWHPWAEVVSATASGQRHTQWRALLLLLYAPGLARLDGPWLWSRVAPLPTRAPARFLTAREQRCMRATDPSRTTLGGVGQQRLASSTVRGPGDRGNRGRSTSTMKTGKHRRTRCQCLPRSCRRTHSHVARARRRRRETVRWRRLTREGSPGGQRSLSRPVRSWAQPWWRRSWARLVVVVVGATAVVVLGATVVVVVGVVVVGVVVVGGVVMGGVLVGGVLVGGVLVGGVVVGGTAVDAVVSGAAAVGV